MKKFSIVIKSLTPIWTGDARGRMTELKETGIIGSMRWWYEALIRGLNGTACDPTACDPTHAKCRGNNHCDSCELFGCTGWARKFRLEASPANPLEDLSIGTREKRGRKYLKRKIGGFMSIRPLTITIIPLRDIAENEWALLNATLKIIEEYGALGAHTSQGNGVISIVQNNLPRQGSLINTENLRSSKNTPYPNLKDFFFLKFQLGFSKNISELIKEKAFWIHSEDDWNFNDKEQFRRWEKFWNVFHFLPIAPHIRDAVRHFEENRSRRHAIFGGPGMGSKVFVSHGYKIDDKVSEARIWGYADNGIKEKIKSELKSELKEKLFTDSSKGHLLKECALKEDYGKKLVEELIS